jgi:hypothetical protein
MNLNVLVLSYKEQNNKEKNMCSIVVQPAVTATRVPVKIGHRFFRYTGPSRFFQASIAIEWPLG